MRVFLVIIITIVVLIPILRAIRNTSLIYELPFLFASSILIYILPSLYILSLKVYIVDAYSFYLYSLNLFLCYILCIAGYYSAYKLKKSRYTLIYTYKSILTRSAFFLIIGSLAGLYLGSMEIEGLWTGAPVYILFIARLIRPASVSLLLLYLLFPKKKILNWLLIIWLYHPINLIFISGRRSEVFILILTLAIPIFLVRNIKVSSKFIIPAFITSYAIILFFPLIREYTLLGRYQEIFSLNFSEYYKRYLDMSISYEVVEAATNMKFISDYNLFNYGSSFYNEFIRQYFPGGLLGRDLKENLLLPEINPNEFRLNLGSVEHNKFWLFKTGFAEVFYSFHFFGSLIFYLFGYSANVLFKKAMQKDMMWMAIYVSFSIYIPFAVVNSITQVPTQLLVAFLIYYLIFRSNNFKYKLR